MDNRVELIIEALGLKPTVDSLKEAQRLTNELNNKKIKIRADIDEAKRKIDQLGKSKERLEKLTRLRMDYSEVVTATQAVAQLDREMKQAEKEAASVAKAQEKAAKEQEAAAKAALKWELDLLKVRQSLEAARQREQSSSIGSWQQRQADIADLTKAMDAARMQQQADGLKAYEQNLDSLRVRAQDTASKVREIGSAFQSIGGAVKSFGSMFDTRILDTIQRYLTVMATRSFMGDWSKAFSRFDILNTYASYLDVVGISADDAQKSLDKLNESIQGLPIGLDQVAYQTRQYQMYLNDLNRATNLTIGLNRALVAGGANEQMRTQTEYEIDRLLAAGELNTSRQWRALLQGLGVSVRFLREEMGLGDIDNRQFVNMLYTKEIAAEDFLRGIERLADSKHLDSVLDIYLTTIESGMSNIRFALTRGKANVLAALDESLLTGTGKNISGWLYEIRDAMNEVYASISGYIRTNPEFISEIINKIISAFQRLKGFDWAGLIEKMTDSLMKLTDALLWVVDNTPDDLFTSLITFGSVWAKPVGTGIQLVGSALATLGTVMLGKGLLQLPSLLNELAISARIFASNNAGLAAGLGTLTKLAGVAAVFAGMGGFYKWQQNRTNDWVISGLDMGSIKTLKELNAEIAKRDELARKRRTDENYNPGNDPTWIELQYLKSLIPEYEAEAEWLKVVQEEKKKLTDAQQDEVASGNAVQNMLTALNERYSEIRESADKSIESIVHGFEEIELAERQSLSKTRSNVESQYKAFKDYNDNMEKITRYIVENREDVDQSFIQAIADLSTNPLDNAGIIAGIANSLDSPEAIANFSETMQQMLEESAKTADLSTTAQMLLGGLSESVYALMEAKGLGLNEILNDPRWEKWLGAGEGLSESAGRSNENAVAEKLALINEKTIETRTGAQELKDELDLLRQAFKPMADEADNTERSIDGVKNTADNASESTDALRTSVNNVGDAMANNVSAVDSFKDSIEQLWSSAVSTTTEINNLRNAIDGIESKDININIHGKSNLPWQINGASYYANGGFVAKGTDTVPAMLTPGEFVIRRNAAKALGTNVLNRLNSLDFSGAIDAMMSNFARPTSMYYNVSNTRNDNRHVSVTQNIQTSNPSYSYRIASRFAHAL